MSRIVPRLFRDFHDRAVTVPVERGLHSMSEYWWNGTRFIVAGIR